MEHHVDVAVLGMGPGGEVAASILLQAGKRVAVFERELIGGECAYWACIPSKTVLRPAEVGEETRKAAGVSGAVLDWEAARDYRDYMARHLDDGGQIDGYRDQGALVVKADARITGPGRIEAGADRFTAEHVIIATGSDAVVPELEGSEELTVWTNRQTYTTVDLPGSAVIVGGSAVAIETATFLSRFGVPVTILNRGSRLLEREEPRVGELAQQYLEAAGVQVLVNATARRGHRDGAMSVLDLDDGGTVGAEVVIFATGRAPRAGDLGLEHVGVALGAHGQVPVDEQCRTAEHVWAIGDVTGIMPFTHVAKYQGRIAADAILGGTRRAHYDGIPRVVFGEPEIAAVGLTQAQADQQGLHTKATELDVAAAIARPWTYEQNPAGHLGLLADTDTNTLIGAWAVSPLAAEWIHHAALAIRTRLPLDVLRDQVPQFPTYHEAYLSALDHLG